LTKVKNGSITQAQKDQIIDGLNSSLSLRRSIQLQEDQEFSPYKQFQTFSNSKRPNQRLISAKSSEEDNFKLKKLIKRMAEKKKNLPPKDEAIEVDTQFEKLKRILEPKQDLV
jgi:hypothetical protein